MAPTANEANGSFARRRFRAAPRDDVSDIAVPDWTLGEDDEEATRRAIEDQRERRRGSNRRVKARQQIVNQPGTETQNGAGPGVTGTAAAPAPTGADEEESESSASSVGTDPETESGSSDSEDLEGDEEEEEDDEEELEGGQAEEEQAGDADLSPTSSTTGLPASTGVSPSDTQSALPETTTNGSEETGTSGNSDNSSSGLSDQAQMGLIIVGAILGVAFIGIGAWFLYRRIRRRRDEPSPPPSYADGLEPSRRVRFLAHVPFLKDRFADRTWFTIDEPYFAAAPSEAAGDEKHRSMTGTDLLGYMPDATPITKPERAVAGGVGTSAPPVPAIPRNVLNLEGKGYYSTYDSNNAQPPRSPTESTLSSGWGNGTYIPPTPLHPPNQRGQPERDSLPPPVPALRRDTMYTEASVASSVPRFRTVKSWVKQQQGRVDKNRTEAVPEQDYGLMMPDEEEPRRVDESSSQYTVGNAR